MQDSYGFSKGDSVIIDREGHWMNGYTGTVVGSFNGGHVVKLNSGSQSDSYADIRSYNLVLLNSYKIAKLISAERDKCEA